MGRWTDNMKAAAILAIGLALSAFILTYFNPVNACFRELNASDLEGFKYPICIGPN